MTLKDAHKIRNILIINTFGIGDILFTTPLIRALKESFPGSFIGYVCNKRTAPILETNPGVNEIFIYEKDDYRELWKQSRLKSITKFLRFLSSIKKRHFDLVVDLSLGRYYNFFSWFLGIKERVGFNYKGRGAFLTRKINIDGFQDKHIVEYYLDFLKYLGIEAKHHNLEVFLTEQDRDWAYKFLKNNKISQLDLVIGISPAGGASWGKDALYKQWNKKGFAKLTDSLIEKYNAKVIFFGDNNELDICAEIIDQTQHKPILTSGQITVRQFVALLKHCNVFICNNSGPLHLAVAAGTKVACISGPVDDKVYGPYTNNEMYKIVKKDMPCIPCYKKFRMPPCPINRKCLEDITPEEVLTKIGELL